MKCTTLLITVLTLLVFSTSLNAQVKNVEKEAERQGTKRINRKIDKGVDKGLDKIEEGIGSLFGKKKKKNKAEENNSSSENQNQNSEIETNKSTEVATPKMDVQWSKFDFVPGDEVIFEDGPDIMEENGEFPSRWDLAEGNVEIMMADGQNVISYLSAGAIVPYMENSKEDYLPDVFTLECDMYFTQGESGRYWIALHDNKNQRHVGDDIEIYVNGIECGESEMRYPGLEENNWSYNKKGGWRHISVAFTKGKLKVYMDDTRLTNIPHYEGNPTGITISAERYGSSSYQPFIKGVRIAKGGVKYYDRVLSDGKIIVNGIRFDVNKATIKPESNGAINKIFELMQKQPDLNFSVEGHTDSDGDETSNQSLSEARAKSVMDRLIEMGISPNRLRSAGWGESKPLADNGTAEGKANNRRVEFVKFQGNAAPSSSSSSIGNSAFDKLDKKAIGLKLEELPEILNIPISNSDGIVNGTGTVILFATSDGNLGKMQILDVDESDNYKITVKYITYKYNGAVHSQSDHFEIPGTYTCDFDKGTIEDVIYSEVDLRLGRESKTSTTLYQGETSMLRILK